MAAAIASSRDSAQTLLSAAWTASAILFVLAWLNAFIGSQQSADAAREVRQWLAAHPPEPDLARKILEVLDELERTVRIRAHWADKAVVG